ncbi:hypothetical protein BS47DRAFT_1488887 [Hydnum rufescens UP504]|uniref:Vacuolar sorting protein Vps3844 C-terminal domain-containing protein n=1 Tax=Hydnum rufescens UP504 TaxID=1448309 RepID=A0A9P6DQF8_9AGAM|nr:hypothetical protein BS47DRAFT_1488887 [Hydnum rufescens UP504]
MRFQAWQSLSALPIAAVAYGPATVYLRPNPVPTAPLGLPTLSPFEANAVLANFVGTGHTFWPDVLEKIVDIGKKEWDYLFHSIHPREDAIGAGSPDVLMLLLQSDYPQGSCPYVSAHTLRLSTPDIQAHFHNTGASSWSTFVDLLNTYIIKAHSVFDAVVSSIFHSNPPISSTSRKSLLDVFDIVDSESSALFMDEFRALVGLVETEKTDESDSFTALSLEGLAKIAEEHGRESEVYRTAARSIEALLSHDAILHQKLALIVLPVSPAATLHHTLPRSASAPHNLVQARSFPPVHSVSECFTSSDACSNNTDTCSGHGECVAVSRAGKTCYSCVCSTTADSRGRKTSWAGSKCERMDVSMPFILLAGSTIFLIAIGIGSIQLLYSIGDATLPSTLTSTSAGGHLKRD